MPDHSPDSELLTIRQLKRVASQQSQPYRIHAQVDGNAGKETSQGKPYHELKLTDAADSIIWRVFDGSPLFGEASLLQRGAWIELSADWVDTGKFGLDPRNASLRKLTDNEVQALLGGDEELRERQQADYGTITEFCNKMADPRLKALCLLYLQQHEERFQRAAAARDYHHARRGGLVEHVAQMMRCAAKICEAYPTLNRDLLLAGVLFHDCGKLWENNYTPEGFTMPYNLHGEMVGHIVLGLELVNKLWRQLMDSPEAAAWAAMDPANEMVRVHLLHLIGSHHGEFQFGSPVLPKTPEAIVLHHVDNIDAKVEMLRRAYDTSTQLAPGIFERVRPLPQNIIQPLAAMGDHAPVTES
jgi:3'-5' exoribonuclease